MSNYILDDILIHYGIPRKSGRYPWGSGENPYQHEPWYTGGTKKEPSILDRIETLKKQGMSETDIALYLGMSTTEYRAEKAIAKAEQRRADITQIKVLRDQGKTYDEIAKILNKPGESSIRALLNEDAENRMNTAVKVADFLKKQVDEKGFIDVGAGVEQELSISKVKLKQALIILEKEGYLQYNRSIPQVTNPGKQTHIMVLCPPGTQYKDIYEKGVEIHPITDYISRDDGDTFEKKWVYPESMSSKRLMVRYAEEGGKDKDGVIELRRGVEDLDLNGSLYSQVRILVDGTHYLKGMAVYSDDMPEGIDVIFNTNKKSGTPALGEKNNTVLKLVDKKDPDNPFGSLIKSGIDEPNSGNFGGQHYYISKDGTKKLSLINKRSDEGDWADWSDKLPSQFLSKQRLDLINKQLKATLDDKKAEFDDIMMLENPTVKRKLLYSFADDCDSSAVHLKAAALPRQKYQVILPLTSIKDTEVYAPNYKNGETVALVRYPHGGKFEIPILTVNNKNPEGKKIISSNAKDAIGINAKVASQLSGADFDGDTVMVIPCNSGTNYIRISNKPPLKALEDFDPKVEYGGKPEGTFKLMTNTQNEMGIISNLITDMTLKGAPDEEIARAVKHSMVVIDAEKHHLDYRQSEIDNNIKELKIKYQHHIDSDGKEHFGGASTLISRASADKDVLKRRGSPKINPDTGKLEYKTVEEHYIGKDGKDHVRTQKSTEMAEVDDAYILSSGTPTENAYAEYANALKSMANEARLLYLSTGKIEYKRESAKIYKDQVESLENKLYLAEINAPRERLANRLADNYISVIKSENPNLTNAEKKKIAQRALTKYRAQVGAKRTPIIFTDDEWKAIQAGAISDTKLAKMLQYADLDRVRELATPLQYKELSPTKEERLKSMAAQGYTNEQIASALGISASTVSKYLSK